MKYKEALHLAQSWKKRLTPHCNRIEIAGSIRREKPEVKDIELLCIPKTVQLQSSMFAEEEATRHRDPGFPTAITAAPQTRIIKGNPHTGKYIQIELQDDEIKIDIFIATPENWGFMLAIRTGPADYSHKVLGRRWVKFGYHGEDGILKRGGVPVMVPEETDLYNLLDLTYLHPKERRYPELANFKF